MDSGKLNDKWNEVYRHVKTYENLDQSQVDAFFPLLKPQAMSDGFLMLTTNNDFIKSWIEKHYLEAIKQALLDLNHLPYTVLIEVDPAQEQASGQSSSANQKEERAGEEKPPSEENAVGTGGEQAGGSNPPLESSGQATPKPADDRPHDNVAQADDGKTRQQDEPRGTDEGYVAALARARAASAMNAASATETARTAQPGEGIGAKEARSAGGSGQPAPQGGFQSMSYDAAYDRFDPSYDHYHEYEDLKTHLDRVFPQPDYARMRRENTRDAVLEGPASTLTFENFVIGDSNRMAYSMAVSVAETPGNGPLNPLFIYGKSGLGKTHLMRAIQNYIRETQPYLRTVYVDSAELLSDYMEAGAAHDKEKTSYKNFKTRYEEADVLLIDDIQYLQGKKQTLDIVFQIFNKLTNQGKQIILSADRAPKNIDIDERYHSRFNQGGTIDIQPPEIETKLGIVKSFINEYRRNEASGDFSIPEDIQMYIAENSSSNIRELKSAVTKVIYQMTFFQQSRLSVDDVRTLLENHFSGGSSKNLTVEDIQREVENFFKVKHLDLIGPKRARNIVYPRQIAIYLCRQLLDLPFNDIGKKFNRDHSTAMHSVTTVEEMMRESRDVQEEIETLKQIIREL